MAALRRLRCYKLTERDGQDGTNKMQSMDSRIATRTRVWPMRHWGAVSDGIRLWMRGYMTIELALAMLGTAGVGPLVFDSGPCR